MKDWWEERSAAEKVGAVIVIALLIAGAIALFGFVTMKLWNWLMPEIFGLTTISYWQAWGLMLLSWILFKNIGSGSDNSGRKERKRKRHLRKYMSDEKTGEDKSGEPEDSDSGDPASPAETQ